MSVLEKNLCPNMNQLIDVHITRCEIFSDVLIIFFLRPNHWLLCFKANPFQEAYGSRNRSAMNKPTWSFWDASDTSPSQGSSQDPLTPSAKTLSFIKHWYISNITQETENSTIMILLLYNNSGVTYTLDTSLWIIVAESYEWFTHE